MSVNLVPEEDLRDALRPYRADPEAFEAGVRERLEAASRKQADDPLAGLSPLLRSAAALLPIPVITGGKISAAAAAKLVPATGAYKLLGYLAFPAISLFVLLGASLFGAARIRRMGKQTGANPSNEKEIVNAARVWWSNHKKGAWSVYAATVIMQWIGETWILFLMYIVSFGLLLYVLTAFAKVGLGSRRVIGQSCMMGLMTLGQLAIFAGTGDHDIHFIDQHVISAVFLGGGLFLALYLVWSGLDAPRFHLLPRTIRFALFPAVAVPLIVWFLSPILWPATPSRIKAYVESFDRAPFSSTSWQQWEIVASWAVERKLDLDLSRPRQLLATELTTKGNPFILDSALRIGLIERDQLEQPELAKAYEDGLKHLLERPTIPVAPRPREEDANKPAARRHPRAEAHWNRTHEHPAGHPPVPPWASRAEAAPAPTKVRPFDQRIILSLSQKDWLIRAAMLRGDLTTVDCDYLEECLHATMENILAGGLGEVQDIEDPVHVTRMLAAIGRPVEPDRYRILPWLLRFHCQTGGGFQPAGGFKKYVHNENDDTPPASWGDRSKRWILEFLAARSGALPATACAVELMETYGIPPDLDLNWVQTYLKPSWNRQLTGEKWMAAVTLDRLDHLPGATKPSWPDILYYERSLLAAMVLVGLCIYATFTSPIPEEVESGEEMFCGLPDAEMNFPWVRIALALLSAIGAILIVWLLWMSKVPADVVPPAAKRVALPPQHQPTKGAQQPLQP